MHKLIAISGSPGTGKSTLATLLVKKLNAERLDLQDYYKEISTAYNKQKKCYDIDIKKVEGLVRAKKKKHELVINDSHVAHLLPKSLINLCIVLTSSNLKTLEKRLKERKYNKAKIRENLDAEIFQVCLMEAKENGHKVITFDTSKRMTQKELLQIITKNL